MPSVFDDISESDWKSNVFDEIGDEWKPPKVGTLSEDEWKKQEEAYRKSIEEPATPEPLPSIRQSIQSASKELEQTPFGLPAKAVGAVASFFKTTPEQLREQIANAPFERERAVEMGLIPAEQRPYIPTEVSTSLQPVPALEKQFVKVPEQEAFQAALVNELGDQAAQFVSPENLAILGATAGAGMIPKIGQYLVRLGSGYFGLQGLKTLNDASKELGAATTPEEKGKAWAKIVEGAAVAVPTLTHAVSPRIPLEVQELARASADENLTPEQIADAQRRATNLAAPGTVRPGEVSEMAPPSPEKPSMFELGEVPFQGAQRFGTMELKPPQILPQSGFLPEPKIIEETRTPEELETRGKVSFGAEAPTLVRTAIETGKDVGLTKSAKALEESHASNQPSAKSVPQHEVRPPVGEEASLRQSGEATGAQPTIEEKPSNVAEIPKAFDEVKSTEQAWDLGHANQTPEGIGALSKLEAEIRARFKAARDINEKANIASGPLHFIKEAISAAKGETDRPAMTSYLERKGEHESITKLRDLPGTSNTREAMALGKQVPQEQIPRLEKLAQQANEEATTIISEVDAKERPTDADLKRMSESGNRAQLLNEALEAARGGEPAILAREKTNPAGEKAGAEIPSKKQTASDSAKLLADKLRDQFKTPTTQAELGSFGVIPKIINAAVEVAARVIEKGGSLVDAINEAVDHVRKNHKNWFDEDGFRALLNKQFENNKPVIGAEIPPKTESAVEPTLGEVGMGGAKPAELPARPGIEETIPARKAGEVPPVIGETPRPASAAGTIDALRSLFTPEGRGRFAEQAKGFLGGLAGETLPRITSAARAAGEAGARYLSSRTAAPYMARIFSRDVLAGLDVDPVKFGAALSEDNLRSVRAANPEAGGTFSFIGEGKPFKTEAEYQAYLKEPNVQEAIKRHISNWNAVIEPMYREAMRIDPDVELPTRGLQTGARVNLAAVLEGETIPPTGVVGGPRGGLLNTIRRKSPFGQVAKGTGEAYHANYDDLIANSMYRQMEIANKNAFDKSLVDSGLAVVDKPGQEINIGGQRAVAFPLKRPGKASENLYVRSDLAREYRNASNVDDNPYANKIIPRVLDALNKAALAGLTDATVHITNLSTALAQLPVSKLDLLTDSLISVTSRLDLPVAGMRAVKKGAPEAARALLQRSKLLREITPDVVQRAVEDAFWKNQTQLAGLAEIGALKAPHPSAGLPGMRHMSDVIQWYDRTTRMVLDDAYKDLASRGIVENSETARREFINQVGQYNKRAQGVIVRLSRDLGTGPFVTAGRAFNVLGVRAAMLNPGVRATSFGNAVLLRANMASKWLGTFAFVGLVNYLITGRMTGRPGTPIGSIDTGTNDKNGRMKSFSVVNLTGQGRALRVTGARGAIEAASKGLPAKVAADSAARDVINSWVAPFAGPPVKAGFVAASGFPPAISVGRASKVVPPGESQTLENIKQAGIEANPVIAGIVKANEPGKTWEEAVKTQLPRFTMQTKQPEKMIANYPAIVRRAQANAYIEDVIHRARYIEDIGERKAYVREALRQLDPQDRQHAETTLRFRKIQF